MAHSPDIKVKLRAAYIGGLPLEAAAEKIGVPLPTARNWYRADKKAGDDWDAFQKASMIVSGGGVEQALGRIIAAALLRCETLEASISGMDPAESVKAMATLGDTVAKLSAAAKQFMPEATARAIGVDTIKSLAVWAGEVAPAQGMVLAALLDGFAAAKKMQIAAGLEELRARARAAGAVESAKVGGLSDASVNEMRNKILGVGT